MKNAFSILALLFLAFNFAKAQDSTTLIVKISNVKVQTGTVYVGVYDCANNWMKTMTYSGKAKADGKEVMVTFENIPVGSYAISIYHDKNDNQELDTNFFGIPSEPYAFSAGASGRFGPPSWEKATFQVTAAPTTHEIKL